jgi:hypothetical protein
MPVCGGSLYGSVFWQVLGPQGFPCGIGVPSPLIQGGNLLAPGVPSLDSPLVLCCGSLGLRLDPHGSQADPWRYADARAPPYGSGGATACVTVSC